MSREKLRIHNTDLDNSFQISAEKSVRSCSHGD